MKLHIIALLFVSLFLGCVSVPQKMAPIPTKIQDKKLFRKAKKLYTQKKYNRAKTLFKKLVGQSQNTLEANLSYIFLGNIENRKSNYLRASDYYLKVINGKAVNPKEGEAYIKASSSLYKGGKIEEALSLINQGRKSSLVNEKEKEVLTELKAQYHSHLKDYLQAMKAYMVLSKRKKIYESMAQNILETKLGINELKEVARLQDKHFSSYALYKLGLYYLKEGSKKKASQYFKESIALNPQGAITQQAQALIQQIESQSSVSPTTIGLIAPLYTKHSYIAKNVLQGLQLGLGIFGKNRSQFKLAIIDSEANPDVARRGVTKLVVENNVIAIVGGLLGKTSFAIAEKSQEVRLPNIVLSQKSGLTNIGNYIFRNALTSKTQVKKLVEISMNQYKMKKFALLYPKDSYGEEFANLFWNEVESQGGQITAVQAYDSLSTNFSDSIRKLVGTFYQEDRKNEYNLRLKKWRNKIQNKSRRKTKNPPTDLLPPIVNFDGIFIPDVTKALGQIAPLLSYHNIERVTLLGTNLWHSPSLIRRGQKYVEGAIFVDDSLSIKTSLKKTNFYREYLYTFGTAPTSIAAKAYDVGILLRQIISAGESTREGLRERLAATESFSGANGLVKINSNRELLYPMIGFIASKKKIKEINLRKPVPK